MKKTVAILIIIAVIASIFTCSTAVAADTEIGYQMKPLQDKLSALTPQEIADRIARFKDLDTHFCRTQVGKLAAIDILSGTGGGYYSPNNPLQADHFIKMLVCAMGFKPGTGKTYWAQPYIDIAKKYALIKSGEISVYTKPITRELMVKILVRAAMLIETAPGSKYDDYIIGKVKDYYKIADNCKQSVLDSYKLGLITGSNNTFNPKSNLTRAEAAIVLLRFLDVKERKPMKPGPGEVMKIQTNVGDWIELYPGTIPETFTIAKAAQDNIPKAKGYVGLGFNPSKNSIFACFYVSENAWKEDCITTVGWIEIDYEHQEKYVFVLQVNDETKYKKLFVDYVRAVLKIMYSSEKGKAMVISLHDKYMNAKYKRNDGLNDVESALIDNRYTLLLRYPDVGFGIKTKIIGE